MIKIIKPSVERWENKNGVEHVARCARVCYAKHKDTGHQELVDSLIRKNHLSMLRHDTRYYKIPVELYDSDAHIVKALIDDNPYACYKILNNCFYISVNGHYIFDYKTLFERIAKYEIKLEDFVHEYSLIDIIRHTFYVTTTIAIAKELNRKSPNNIAEQSTRYVDLQDVPTIVQSSWYDILGDCNQVEVSAIDNLVYPENEDEPTSLTLWLGKNIEHNKDHQVRTYIQSCEESFDKYKTLRKTGLAPQFARDVLPLATMTKVAYTYTRAEWEHIINLRLHGITGKPHPDAAVVAEMIKNELIKFDDNIYGCCVSNS